MTAPRRPGEITYYEELGVGSRASAEEIREAYRALARILHPDQQSEPELKRVAEAQMRKLNRIHATLADPQRRRQYDELLDGEYDAIILPLQPRFHPAFRSRLSRAAWAAAILCGVTLLIWFTVESTSSPPGRARETDPSAEAIPAASPEPAAVTTPDQATEIAGLRSDLRALTMERDAAVREIGRLRGRESKPQANGPDRPETAELRLPAPIADSISPGLPAPAGAPPSRTEKPVSRKIAGFWFYAIPPHGQHNKNQALYPPEYIELTISEENGAVHGNYRSRFRIADRAISPDVNFTFTGAPFTGSQGTYPWTGAAGAKGQLTLRFMSENSLRIDWNATDLGTQQGLDEGTAILIRRID